MRLSLLAAGRALLRITDGARAIEFQAGDGTLTQFHTGSTFRAASATSDFTLVELIDPPVPAWAKARSATW